MMYPIGSVLPYAGPRLSDTRLKSLGLLPCDGRELSRSDATFAALYHAIGVSYGGTTTTFCIPDYGGRFLRGTDLGRGTDPAANARTAPRPKLVHPGNAGDRVGSIQAGSLAAHTHSYSMHDDFHRVNYGSLIGPGVYVSGDLASEVTTGTGENETRPKNAYVDYLIVFANDVVDAVEAAAPRSLASHPCTQEVYSKVSSEVRACFEANARKQSHITWSGGTTSGTFTYHTFLATVKTNYTYDPESQVFTLQVVDKPSVVSCSHLYDEFAGGLKACGWTPDL